MPHWQESLVCRKENVIIGEIGNVIETDGNKMKIVSQVPAGKVLVDGLGVGDVGSIVLRDRKHLAQDGLIIVVKQYNCFRSGYNIERLCLCKRV